ncbi:hypothetical protein ST37_04285 [Vibrio sp. qd031]|nr:hypothetical protein ST37_04285 [Vibrio sp. qd031]
MYPHALANALLALNLLTKFVLELFFVEPVFPSTRISLEKLFKKTAQMLSVCWLFALFARFLRDMPQNIAI